MKKLIEKIKANKVKSLIIGFASILIIVLLVVAIVLVINKNKISEKEMLTNEIERIGRRYYEDFYYVTAGNGEKEDSKAEYFKKFASVGLKINLENLLRYDNTLKDKSTVEFKNTEKNEECNKQKTMVTIYPKEPYGKEDYQISIYLDCGFDE